MAIEASPVTEDKNSLAVCLDTILAYEGIMRNSEYMLSLIHIYVYKRQIFCHWGQDRV